MRCLLYDLFVLCIAGVWLGPNAHAAPSGVWVRVTLRSPQALAWRAHIIVHRPGGQQTQLWAALPAAAGSQSSAAPGAFLPAGAPSPWIDLSQAIPTDIASVRFLFETTPALGGKEVRAIFDVATADSPAAIVRSIAEHDPGGVIALRIPHDLVKDRKWLLSIREDSERRLREIRALHLPEGPLPRKIWCMTGFRSNGQFYTDPAIARMDFDIIHELGMNGFWEQNGGQPGPLREMAQARGIDRSTVYWRSVESPPRGPDGHVDLDWPRLENFIDSAYTGSITNTRAAHPDGMPTVIADLMDEPAGQSFEGPEYEQEFRTYLRGRGFSPEFFGKAGWEDVTAPALNWGSYFKLRAAMDASDVHARRLFYWAVRFWNESSARLYALATRKVEAMAPGVGTRVNLGPPWWYDYGTLPRGTDIVDFGRLHSVSLGFNEDWVGSGSPRLPAELGPAPNGTQAGSGYSRWVCGNSKAYKDARL